MQIDKKILQGIGDLAVLRCLRAILGSWLARYSGFLPGANMGQMNVCMATPDIPAIDHASFASHYLSKRCERDTLIRLLFVIKSLSTTAAFVYGHMRGAHSRQLI